MVQWAPIILIVAFWIFMLRQMQSNGGKAMGFGKSRARLLTERQGRDTFDDVAGIEEAKNELEEIVDFLKDPQKFQRLGGKIPKGCLLVGPPGTGKTLLARAIAGEANVPFFTISGSDFVEMFVGVGASGTLRIWTFRICSRPLISGLGTTICRSKRPGRSSAGSSTSGRLVAAIRMTPSLDSKPSISTSNAFRVCSRSS